MSLRLAVRRFAGEGIVLLAFAVVPAVLCQWLAESPGHRHIHVEAFRYGKEPSVIRCNRGDWLHLTFSTRDTGHSFFLEEFDIDAKIRPASRDVLVFRPSWPDEPGEYQSEVILRAEHPGWLKYLVSKSQYRCHVYCGPMHAFEHGNLIIYPNTLLFAAWGLIAGICVIGWRRVRAAPAQHAESNGHGNPVREGWDLLLRFPWLKRLLKMRSLQMTGILMTTAVLYVVILASLFGSKVAGRNFGVMTTWVVWLFALTVVLTPFGGRLWCLVCPLPALGDILQRRAVTGVRTGNTGRYNNRFFGWNLRWPKWLDNDWPRIVVFLAFGTFSTLLVAVPRFTGWIIVSLIVLATAMSLVWELRAFCRYLCPVTAFVGLYGKAGKLALRVANPNVCTRCTLHTCQLGNDKGWACPFGLCAEQIQENSDCGMCTECIKSCAYDNVTLRWRPFAQEIRVRSMGEAWLAMVMLVMAAAYCLVHLGHWPALRDCVNILDKGNWSLFAIFGLLLWLAALVGMPLVLFTLSAIGRRWASVSHRSWLVMRASSGALIPMGLMLWVAFAIPMLMVNISFVYQAWADPFGAGGIFGSASVPWHQLWPRAIPWLQVGCVLSGLGYSLRNGWRIWQELTGSVGAAFRGAVPLWAFLILFSAYFVWFFAN